MNRELLPSIANALAESTKAYLAPVLSTFADRIAALEARVANIKDGAPGLDGKDADLDLLTKQLGVRVSDAVDAAVKAYPWDTLKGEKGDPGEGIVGPPGPAGEKGESVQGRDGTDGLDGKDADTEALLKHIDLRMAESVKAAVSAYPWDTLTVIGPIGPPGPPGPTGKDGISLAALFIDRDGCLIATLGDGKAFNLGTVQGPPGRDGKDAVGFDELGDEFDEHGHLYLAFRRGDEVKRYRIPGHIDRGVYRPEQKYLKGDSSTWAGSLWIAQVDEPPGKPGTEGSGWRLAVKRGDIGKPGGTGPVGPKGDRGDKGDPGRGY